VLLSLLPRADSAEPRKRPPAPPTTCCRRCPPRVGALPAEADPPLLAPRRALASDVLRILLRAPHHAQPRQPGGSVRRTTRRRRLPRGDAPLCRRRAARRAPRCSGTCYASSSAATLLNECRTCAAGRPAAASASTPRFAYPAPTPHVADCRASAERSRRSPHPLSPAGQPQCER
jgi:hypothetical protein